MAPHIVYVHGNGPKVRAELLRRQWDVALFRRDMGEMARMAYWAAVRYPDPLPDPASDDGAEQGPAAFTAGEAAPGPPEAFVATTLREARRDASLVREDVAGEAALARWLERMTYVAEALAEGERFDAAARSPSAVAELLGPLGPVTFRALVRRTFKDVYGYFFGGDKEAMRAVVREALDGLDGPVVVIGHSLGSILAYDVLREAGRRPLDIPLLVTVGSPLGVAEVQALIERPLEVPVGVAAWRNASDPRDLVALDHTLRPEFEPPKRCIDLLVRNRSANHHAIVAYLQAAAVREPVLAVLTRVGARGVS